MFSTTKAQRSPVWAMSDQHKVGTSSCMQLEPPTGTTKHALGKKLLLLSKQYLEFSDSSWLLTPLRHCFQYFPGLGLVPA